MQILVIVTKSNSGPNEKPSTVQISRQIIRHVLLAVSDVSEAMSRMTSLQVRVDNISVWDCLIQDSNDGSQPFFEYVRLTI